jgi:4-phospho-D-threonate 3-dehydrogenase / 4-phospho-D-erythronate 3-dehydrogenase
MRPLLAVTLGDPAGIGPEIVARTLADPKSTESARGLAVGDAAVLRRAADVCGLDLEINPVHAVDDARFVAGVIDILDLGVAGADLEWGKVDATAGRSAIAAIEAATRLALNRQADAVVTAPINKEAIWAAGSEHLGHTEMLGKLTGVTRQNTMFVVHGLKIFFTTRHMSLRRALDQITEDTVEHAIHEAHTALRVFGHDRPRLAVATVQAAGLDVTGPVPADAVFHQGLRGRYDGVLCHFHDQGHIAAKTYDFDGTVSVTVGLPILRTSVDHGTAFDIAGTGKASSATMAAAVDAAVGFAPNIDRIRTAYAP